MKACIIGLGTIGMPIACHTSTKYKVHGVDINSKIISDVHDKKFNSHEPGLNGLLYNSYKNGTLTLSSDIENADVYIIVIPIKMNNNIPDPNNLLATIDKIIPFLQDSNLVVIETTCPPNVGEKIHRVISSLPVNVSFAYCPERILPGNILQELKINDRVLGVNDDASWELAYNFYSNLTEGDLLRVTVKEAELIKIIENTYRDVNIAFANEIAQYCYNQGLDPFKVINIANAHPRVNILQPGPGVGGHCIKDNPWFLITHDIENTRMALTARQVNLKKEQWCLEKIETELRLNHLSEIICFGASYKANVGDLRLSPAMNIIAELKKKFKVTVIDPYILDSDLKIENVFQKNCLFVGLVNHDCFKHIPVSKLQGKHILDFAGVFS